MHIVQQAILLELLHKIEHRLIKITEWESWGKSQSQIKAKCMGREWMGLTLEICGADAPNNPTD
jgi:hypothetical protein